ncbi:hypothetical protein C8R43DRAFT_580839 [Mycena crocata]|nr:hypothetical protein C8R43DRAFT_580839 [Mycena crocata]
MWWREEGMCFMDSGVPTGGWRVTSGWPPRFFFLILYYFVLIVTSSSRPSSFSPSNTELLFIHSSATSNGVVYTSIVLATQTIPAGSTITPSTPAAKSNSHTGAIAGGVVGGIAALVLAVLGIWFVRKRSKERRLKEAFDGNFDPGRTTGPTLPHVTQDGGELGMQEEGDDGMGGRLAGSSIGGGVVTPFTTGAGVGAAAAYGDHHHHQQHAQGQYPQQQQYYADGHPSNRHSQYHNGAAAGGYETATSDGPLSPGSSSGYYPASSAGYPTSSAGYPAAPMSAATSSSGGGYPNPMSAKEREARGGGLGVANPTPQMSMAMPGAGMSSMPALPNPHSPGSPGNVVVHQDGGRVPVEEEGGEGMREIPPTYDSIRS